MNPNVGYYNDNLILVWNLETNSEVFNYSTNTYLDHINGLKSKAGYIRCNQHYVNLDLGLENHFFEKNFNSVFTTNCGTLINKTEDCMLEDHYLVRKETMLELETVDNYISCDFQLNKSNICLERIRFNIDGNSALHYFALDPDCLSIILDYMEEKKIGYLNAILMKNKRGKSPIDITIDNESPKCTELLLKKLTLFQDSKLSNLFYDRFIELFNMNLKAFHQYLES